MPLSQVDAPDAARALRERIESEADAVERAATMTPKVVDAIAESGLFKLTTPAAFGGAEAHPDAILAVCEELSFADGSVGWAYAQNITVGAYAAYVAPDVGKELSRARTAAGMFAPMGVAVPETGGYRVRGNYKFGSGSGHAEWIGGGAMVLENGQPVPLLGGTPILAFVIPKEKAVIKGNWDVMGLCGTGSYDFDVPEQFIEEGACFPLFAGEPRTGGPVYRIGRSPSASRVRALGRSEPRRARCMRSLRSPRLGARGWAHCRSCSKRLSSATTASTTRLSPRRACW
jgi:alkylation response protein AidB-like acyl-CoA dehydrogenase